MSDNVGVNAAASLSLNVDTASSESRVDSLNAKLDALLSSLDKLAQKSGKVSISATVKAAGVKEAIDDVQKNKAKLGLDTSAVDAQLLKYQGLNYKVKLNLSTTKSQLEGMTKNLIIPTGNITQAVNTSAKHWADVVIQQQKANNELQRTLDTLTSKGQTVVTQASKDLINFSSSISGAAKRFSIKPEEAVKGLQLLTGRFTETKALVEKGIDLSQVNKMADTMRMLGNNTAAGVSKSIEYLTKLQNRLKQLPEGTSAADVKKTYIQQFGIDPTTIDAELAALQRRQDIQTRWDERRIAQRKKALAEEKAINDSYDAEAKRALRIWRQDDKRTTGGIARRAETAANVDFKDFFSSQTIAAAEAGYTGVGRKIYAAQQAVEQFGEAQAKAFLGPQRHLVDLIGTLDRYQKKSKDAASETAAVWASMSQADQLRAAIKAGRAYYTPGVDATKVKGAAALPQALEMAQAAGDVSILEKQLNAITPAHAKAGEAAKIHAAKLKELKDHAWDAHSAARGLAGGLNALWLTYGATLPLLAGAALSGGFVQATKAGSEFAYQLTFVKGLGGETAKSISEVSAAALSLSKNSLAGPVEMAQGLRILAQAGLNAKEAIYALPQALDLATVGEMNMEQAATTLVGVMNAFSLRLTDVSHIGDVFAKAAAESQTSVQGMTEAMKYASVVGEQYGASLEDTATAVTLLAKMNITGTAAGTSFRNMLKELYSPSKQAADVMQTLGLRTKDSLGNLRDFPDIIYDLKGRLSEFNKGAQVNILQTLFGERGAKEAIAMLSLTREQWDELNNSISNSSGFIRGVAAELETTTKGAFKQAVNTLQSNLIKAFDASEDSVKGLAVALKSLADSPEFVQGISAIVSGIANLGTAAANITPTLIKLGEAWLAFKAITLTGGALATLGGIAGGFTLLRAEIGLAVAAAGGWAAAAGSAGKVTADVAKATTALHAANTAGTAAQLAATGAAAKFATVLSTLANPITLAVAALGGLVYWINQMRTETPEGVKASADFVSALSRQVEKLKETNKELYKQVQLKRELAGLDGQGASEVDARKKALKDNEEEIKRQRAILTSPATANTVAGNIQRLEARNRLIQLEKDRRDMTSLTTEGLKEERRQVIGELEALYADYTKTLNEEQTKAAKASNGKNQGLTDPLKGALGGLRETIDVLSRPVVEAVGDSTEAVEKGVTDARKVLTGYKKFLDGVTEDVRRGPSGSKDFQKPDGRGGVAGEAYREQLAELKNFTQQYEAIYTQFTEGTKLKTLKGELAETDAIRANTAARISLYEAEIKKQEAIIALAERNRGTKGAGRDIEDAEGKIATLRTKIETAVIEGNNQIISVNEKLSADIAKAWALAGKQSVNEIDVLTAKFYAENQNLLRAMAAGSVEAGEAVAAAVDAIAKKTQFSQANKVFEASLATIQTRVAEIEEEISSSGGGWIQRWIGGEEIFAIVQNNIDALTAKIEDLKRKAAEMEPGSTDRAEADKQIAQYQKQLTTLKKSTGKVWADVIQNIDKTFHDGFVRMLEGGKSGWEAWAKSLKNTFKSIVADSIYQMFARPFVLNLVGNVAEKVGANGLAAAANNAAAGGAFNLAGSAGSSLLSGAVGSGLVGLGGAIGSGTAVGGFATGLGTSLANGVGFSGTMAAGKALAALPGGGAAGLGMQVGAFMPYVGAALAVATAIGAFGKSGAPKVNIGGGGTISQSGIKLDPTGQVHWEDSYQPNKEIASSILTDQLVSALMKINSSYTAGAFIKGHLNIKGRSSNQNLAQATGQSGNIIYHKFTEEGKGTEDFQKFLADQVPKLQLALIVDAMRSAGGEIKNVANGLVGTADDLTQALDGMDTAAVNDMAAGLSSLTGVLKTLKALSGSEASGTAVVELAKLSGGAQNFAATLTSYTDSVLTDTQKQAAAHRLLEESFAALNVPVAKTTDELHTLVVAQDYATDAGRRTALALMQLAPTLKNLTSAAEQEAKSIQSKIDTVLGNTAAIRAKELAALTPANQALQQRLWALEDEAKVTKQRIELQNRLDELLGNTSAIRARELALLEPANQALQSQVWALEDAKEAQEKYTKAVDEAKSNLESAESAVKSAQSNVDSVLNSATNNYLSALSDVESAQARIASLNLQSQIEAARTAQQAIDKFKEVGKTLREFIFGETGTADTRFKELLTKALAGDSEAMSKIPEAAKAAMEAAVLSAASSTEAALAQGKILADVSKVMALAEAKGSATVSTPTEPDPMVEAQANLTKAQQSLADALRVAQTIGAPLQKAADSLIAEYNKAMQELAKAVADQARFQKALDDIVKTNGDTNIALDNLKTQLINTLNNNFSTLDTTLDGALSFDEFAAGFANLASEATLKSIFTELDVNGDGQLSKLEAIKAATQGTQAAVNNMASKEQVWPNSLTFSPDNEMLSIFKAIRENTALTSAIFLGALATVNQSSGSLSIGSPLTVGSMTYPGAWAIWYEMLSHLSHLRYSSDGAGIRVRFDRWPYTGGVYAKGGVFTNSVVSSPTYFDRSLMGEAGPEAIMPLTRMPDGSLGVQAKVETPQWLSQYRATQSSDVVGAVNMMNENSMYQSSAFINTLMRMVKIVERWDNQGIPQERLEV